VKQGSVQAQIKPCCVRSLDCSGLPLAIVVTEAESSRQRRLPCVHSWLQSALVTTKQQVNNQQQPVTARVLFKLCSGDFTHKAFHALLWSRFIMVEQLGAQTCDVCPRCQLPLRSTVRTASVSSLFTLLSPQPLLAVASRLQLVALIGTATLLLLLPLPLTATAAAAAKLASRDCMRCSKLRMSLARFAKLALPAAGATTASAALCCLLLQLVALWLPLPLLLLLLSTRATALL
jgi:hypothetical protein